MNIDATFLKEQIGLFRDTIRRNLVLQLLIVLAGFLYASASSYERTPNSVWWELEYWVERAQHTVYVLMLIFFFAERSTDWHRAVCQAPVSRLAVGRHIWALIVVYGPTLFALGTLISLQVYGTHKPFLDTTLLIASFAGLCAAICYAKSHWNDNTSNSILIVFAAIVLNPLEGDSATWWRQCVLVAAPLLAIAAFMRANKLVPTFMEGLAELGIDDEEVDIEELREAFDEFEQVVSQSDYPFARPYTAVFGAVAALLVFVGSIALLGAQFAGFRWNAVEDQNMLSGITLVCSIVLCGLPVTDNLERLYVYRTAPISLMRVTAMHCLPAFTIALVGALLLAAIPAISGSAQVWTYFIRDTAVLSAANLVCTGFVTTRSNWTRCGLVFVLLILFLGWADSPLFFRESIVTHDGASASEAGATFAGVTAAIAFAWIYRLIENWSARERKG